MDLRKPYWLYPTEERDIIACVFAAGEAAQRLMANRRPDPIKPRPHADPARRRNNPMRDYGLTAAEAIEWRRLIANNGMTRMEAANVLLRSRREAGR